LHTHLIHHNTANNTNSGSSGSSNSSSSHAAGKPNTLSPNSARVAADPRAVAAALAKQNALRELGFLPPESGHAHASRTSKSGTTRHHHRTTDPPPPTPDLAAAARTASITPIASTSGSTTSATRTMIKVDSELLSTNANTSPNTKQQLLHRSTWTKEKLLAYLQ
jgi:hypothetical protein